MCQCKCVSCGSSAQKLVYFKIIQLFGRQNLFNVIFIDLLQLWIAEGQKSSL